jgi:peptide deformylase
MALLRICKYGEKVLRKKTKLVKEINADIRRLVKDMFETMYDAPGIGLAAPQVGVSLRLAVVDLQLKENNPGPLVLVNPQILARRTPGMSEEGCLSIPGPVTTVTRSGWVKIKALDQTGKEMVLEGTGLLARCFQHEIDHLDGKLIINRANLSRRTKMWWEIRRRKKAGLW